MISNSLVETIKYPKEKFNNQLSTKVANSSASLKNYCPILTSDADGIRNQNHLVRKSLSSKTIQFG